MTEMSSATVGTLMCAVLLGFAPPSSGADEAEHPSPWEPMRHFIGAWSGEGSGQPGRRRFVLRQFHVEGFVNQYVADSLVAGADSIVFTSEAIENLPPGYREREIYRILGPDAFIERFEIAEPDGDFPIYSETRFRRAR